MGWCTDFSQTVHQNTTTGCPKQQQPQGSLPEEGLDRECQSMAIIIYVPVEMEPSY